MDKRKKRIAFVLCAGADNGGGNTIANQIEKVECEEFDFKVFCNVKNEYSFGCNEKEVRTKNFIMFSDYRELYRMLKDDFYAVFIITNPRKYEADYVKMITKLKCKKVFLAVNRNIITVRKDVSLYSEVMREFDCILTFGDKSTTVHRYLSTINGLVTDFDFNFFDWTGMRRNKKSNKKKIVLYAGRYVNIKGYNKIIEHSKEVLDGLRGIKVCIAGGAYSIGKNGSISSTLGILATICKDKKTKELKDGIEINGSYDDFYELKTDKIQLYPSFANKDIDDIFFNSLFCLMPTRYESTNRNAGMFRLAIEYTWLEAVKNGTPIICTKTYGEECEVNGKKLIDCDCGFIFIDSFTELREKVKQYLKNYDENVEKMQKFFKENYSNDFRIKAIEDLLEKLK